MTAPRQQLTGRRSDFFASPRVLECLRHGIDWSALDPTIGPPSGLDGVIRLDQAALRDAWTALRDAMLADWVREKPGSRPWAWWHFESPERRQCVSGTHPHDDPVRRSHVAEIAARPGTRPGYWDDLHSLAFGVPACLLSGDFAAEYESEADYLERLDLLLPGERERLAVGGAL